MTSPKPTRSVVPAKGAKARVMFTYKNARGEKCVQSHRRDLGRGPWTVAVIPCATRKQARALVQWANLTREQKVEAIARILTDRRGGSMITSHTRRDAVAITDVSEGPAP